MAEGHNPLYIHAIVAYGASMAAIPSQIAYSEAFWMRAGMKICFYIGAILTLQADFVRLS
jgi:hypothetical protein